ncbi:MAG: recombinase family protein [Anaerolineae bacterium]|nr:recombinase family protein [Anaerolineae bacterium]
MSQQNNSQNSVDESTKYVIKDRAALYARTSYDDQKNEGRNLEGQIVMGREYCKQQDYEVVAEIKEEGVSGANWNLPGLEHLLELAKNKEIDVVVIREVDRFSRDLGKLLWLEKDLEKFDVRIEYVLESYDNTPEGDLLRHIRGIVAQYEREKTKQRSVRGRRNKVRAGHVSVAQQPPYGYKLISNGYIDKLEICEKEATIIRAIFEWYTGPERLGVRLIAKRLTEMKIPTYKDLRVKDPEKLKKFKRRNGYGHWTSSSVRMILGNRTYIGEWQFGKRRNSNGKLIENPEEHRITVEVPPIITMETWQITQQRLEENRSVAKRNIKHEYLLAKRLTCQCGLSIMGNTKWNNGILYQYYRCPSSDRFRYSNSTCDLPSFRVKHVDGIIWEWLKSILTDPNILKEALASTQAERERERNLLQERLQTVKTAIGENKAQLKRALDLHISGEVAHEMLSEKIAGLETAINALKKQERAFMTQLNQLELTEEQAQDIIDQFAQKVDKGIFYAETNINVRRQLIEALDLEGTLAVENDQKIIYVSCRLGDITLPILNVDWQILNTTAPKPSAATGGPFTTTPTSKATNC